MKNPIRPCVQEKCPNKKQRTQGLIYRTTIFLCIAKEGDGWLVLLEFNTTLTAKVISWRSVTHMFPGFLTPVLTELFFPKPPTTFLTCFCRGERRKYVEKNSRIHRGSNSQPPGHESGTLTTKPTGRRIQQKINNLNKIRNLESPVIITLGLHLLETGVCLNYSLTLIECNLSGFRVKEYNISPPRGLSTMLYNDMK